MTNLIKEWAISCHEDTNHKYDGKPYQLHLEMVANTAKQFSYLIPVSDIDIVIQACWCHDLIEDCRKTYNDIKENAGVHVADIVYAVTNEKGKTRKERANEKYYKGIRDCQYATFVKICDRIANLQYSVATNSRMIEVYRKEAANFKTLLFLPVYRDMFEKMDFYLKQHAV